MFFNTFYFKTNLRNSLLRINFSKQVIKFIPLFKTYLLFSICVLKLMDKFRDYLT